MLKRKKIAAIALSATLALSSIAAFTGCSGSNNNSNSSNSNSSNSNTAVNANANQSNENSNVIMEADPSSPYSKGIHHATLTIEGYDPVTIELDADAAPITVQHFCELANDGFYDGLSFYRFVDDFCLQGGSSNYSAAKDPNSTQPTIKGEFSYNKVDNPLADKFGKGTVSMARASDPNSADTTFFITMASGAQVSASLNHNYAAFGTIDEEGMEIIDKVFDDYVKNVDDQQSGAISDKDKQAIIKSIKITD